MSSTLQVKTPCLEKPPSGSSWKNGSHLNVIDDSDLTDFICHHAWFEGDEVALPTRASSLLVGKSQRPDTEEASNGTTLVGSDGPERGATRA